MVNIEQTALSNGLRVVIQPDSTLPLVGVSLIYDVGSRVEKPGSSGMAHLVEHLMFQGSEHVAPGEFIHRIQGWGGAVNGMTGAERTTYYHSLPSHQFALGLWMDADRMRGVGFDEAAFERQRATVLDERLERINNSPYGEALVRIGELSYDDFGYGHPVIGYRDDVACAQSDDARQFHAQWYAPSNAVLAMVGDVDPDEAIDAVHTCFGAVPRADTPTRPSFSEARRMVPTRESLRAPLASAPALFVNHPAVPYGDPDFYVYEVIEALLFRGPSSRLNQRMVMEERCAVKVQGGYEAHRGPSLFSFFGMMPEGGDPDRLAALYADELERLVKQPVSEDELERVHNRVRAGRLFGRQSMVHRANALGRSLLYHSDALWEDRYVERILRVGPEAIQRVAARDFDPNASVTLEVMPA